MKRKTRKNNKNKIVFFGLVLLALIVIGLVIYFVFIQGSSLLSDGSRQDSEAIGDTTVSTDGDDREEIDSADKNESDSSLPVTEPEKGIVHDQPSTGNDLGVWVTLSDVVNGTLRIRVQIDQNIGSGTCDLTIGDYSESVPVIAQPQSASCQGFDIPTSAYSGNEFSISIRSGNKAGSVRGAISE